VLNHERSLAVMSPLYESIGVPTLILWGESDAVTPIAQGRELAKLIPGATMVELPTWAISPRSKHRTNSTRR
jgi:pimeloyl-ACP methyl ester carboxylesterase